MWLCKAAEQNNAHGQNNLGGMYSEGRGVPQDHALAYAWLSLAAEASTDGRAVEARAELARRMSAAERMAARAEMDALRRFGAPAP